MGRLRRTLRSLPPLSRMGVLVLAAGVALDVGAHLLGAGSTLPPRCCGPAFVGRPVTLAGTILAVAGVLALAVRRSRPAEPREGRG
jgi:hypothetical protein